jgi:protein TilB
LYVLIFILKLFFLVSIELIRKRSEHNEGEIGTLEEISLHQEDITKIENLQNWCKNLKILFLQSNLIFKIGKLNNV